PAPIASLFPYTTLFRSRMRARMADMSEKPEVDFTPGPAPTELVIEDIAVGDGDDAVSGGVVDVHYVGVDFETGEQFDSSWDRGQDRKSTRLNSSHVKIS